MGSQELKTTSKCCNIEEIKESNVQKQHEVDVPLGPFTPSISDNAERSLPNKFHCFVTKQGFHNFIDFFLEKNGRNYPLDLVKD